MGYGLDVKATKYTEEDGLCLGRATHLIEEKDFFPPPKNPYDAALLIIDPNLIKMEDENGRPYILCEKIEAADGTFSLRFFLADYAPDWLREQWDWE